MESEMLVKQSGGKWTPEEDEKLKKIVHERGPKNWKAISLLAFDGARSDVQCLHRWQKVLRPGLVKGPWLMSEDQIIVEMIQQHGLGNVKWSEIAANLPGRLGKQCRERWVNHLDPDLKKTPWTDEEDKVLMEQQERLGNKWRDIAVYLPGRSENSVKNRWNSTKRKLKRSEKSETENNNDQQQQKKQKPRKQSQKPKEKKQISENLSEEASPEEKTKAKKRKEPRKGKDKKQNGAGPLSNGAPPLFPVRMNMFGTLNSTSLGYPSIGSSSSEFPFSQDQTLFNRFQLNTLLPHPPTGSENSTGDVSPSLFGSTMFNQRGQPPSLSPSFTDFDLFLGAGQSSNTTSQKAGKSQNTDGQDVSLSSALSPVPFSSQFSLSPVLFQGQNFLGGVDTGFGFPLSLTGSQLCTSGLSDGSSSQISPFDLSKLGSPMAFKDHEDYFELRKFNSPSAEIASNDFLQQTDSRSTADDSRSTDDDENSVEKHIKRQYKKRTLESGGELAARSKISKRKEKKTKASTENDSSKSDGSNLGPFIKSKTERLREPEETDNISFTGNLYAPDEMFDYFKVRHIPGGASI